MIEQKFKMLKNFLADSILTWILYAVLLAFLAPVGLTQAHTRCAIATGILNCSSDPAHTVDAEVALIDDDTFGWFQPDRMGWTTSDDFGRFRVEGCGWDLWSDPDPYVRIYTKCNAPRGKYVRTVVVYKFAPDTIDYGVISLD